MELHSSIVQAVLAGQTQSGPSSGSPQYFILAEWLSDFHRSLGPGKGEVAAHNATSAPGTSLAPDSSQMIDYTADLQMRSGRRAYLLVRSS